MSDAALESWAVLVGNAAGQVYRPRASIGCCSPMVDMINVRIQDSVDYQQITEASNILLNPHVAYVLECLLETNNHIVEEKIIKKYEENLKSGSPVLNLLMSISKVHPTILTYILNCRHISAAYGNTILSILDAFANVDQTDQSCLDVVLKLATEVCRLIPGLLDNGDANFRAPYTIAKRRTIAAEMQKLALSYCYSVAREDISLALTMINPQFATATIYINNIKCLLKKLSCYSTQYCVIRTNSNRTPAENGVNIPILNILLQPSNETLEKSRSMDQWITDTASESLRKLFEPASWT